LKVITAEETEQEKVTPITDIASTAYGRKGDAIKKGAMWRIYAMQEL
jgi:hypothetical protein